MITLDDIQASFHSIKISDGVEDLLINVDGSLNAVVSATDLDIRDLAFATDSVDVSGSTVELGATTLAALESITVVATDLDIRNLVFADDKVDVSGSSVSVTGDVNVTQGTSPWTVDGTVELGATTLAALESITVVATDLDIRNLSHSQDSVKIGDGTDFLAINTDGSLNVQTVEAGYASWSVIAASIDSTAGGTQIAASPLSGRLRVEIQNLGDKDIYIRQSTGVTISNGLKIPKGTSYEQALDAGAAIWAITPSGTADVRIAQYAA